MRTPWTTNSLNLPKSIGTPKDERRNGHGGEWNGFGNGPTVFNWIHSLLEENFAKIAWKTANLYQSKAFDATKRKCVEEFCFRTYITFLLDGSRMSGTPSWSGRETASWWGFMIGISDVFTALFIQDGLARCLKRYRDRGEGVDKKARGQDRGPDAEKWYTQRRWNFLVSTALEFSIKYQMRWQFQSQKLTTHLEKDWALKFDSCACNKVNVSERKFYSYPTVGIENSE